MSCRSAPNCSERRHTAREQQAEARITYRFHPRFGESVRVRRRLERGGATFVVVHQLDGTFACLPVWMTDGGASRFEIGDEPLFPLDVLRSLRNEVDALLGFLASESKTERPENDAPIRESPGKPVRGPTSAQRVLDHMMEAADPIEALALAPPPPRAGDDWSAFIKTVKRLHSGAAGWPAELETARLWYERTSTGFTKMP